MSRTQVLASFPPFLLFPFLLSLVFHFQRILAPLGGSIDELPVFEDNEQWYRWVRFSSLPFPLCSPPFDGLSLTAPAFQVELTTVQFSEVYLEFEPV